MKLSLRTWVHRPVSSTPRCRLPTLSQPKPSTRRPTGIPRAAPRGRQASSHRPVPGKPGLRAQSRLLGNQRSGRYGRTRIGEEEGEFSSRIPARKPGKGERELYNASVGNGLREQRREEDQTATPTQTQKGPPTLRKWPAAPRRSAPLTPLARLRAFANTALRTAAGLRRNRAWPRGSSPPSCADWRRAAARLLIGWRRSHSGRLWRVRLPESDKFGFRHASAPAASRSSMEVAASTGWWLQQRLL